MMDKTPQFLLALSTAWLLWPTPDLEANCEVGGYLIHTVAEYTQQDDAREWFFRYELAGEQIRLLPTASQSDEVLHRLTFFLRGPHRPSFSLGHLDRSCAPDLSRPKAVVLAPRNDDLMQRGHLTFPSCLDATGIPTEGFARFDRDAKILTLPRSLPVARQAAANREGWEADVERRLFALNLRAEQGAEETITPDDVEQIGIEVLRVGAGDPSFFMIVAKLRLRHLDRLMSPSSFHSSETLRGKLAEFPVIFFQRPGAEPFYIGDGSLCSSYRLITDVASTVRDLGPMERFELTAAYDLSGDGTPDVLLINGLVAYHLSVNDELEVIDWQQGC